MFVGKYGGSQEGGDDGIRHVDVGRPGPYRHVAAAEAHRPQRRPSLPACRSTIVLTNADKQSEVTHTCHGGRRAAWLGTTVKNKNRVRRQVAQESRKRTFLRR